MPRPKKNSYSNKRPPFSYISLCVMAIESSPTKMMTLREMYQYVAERFEFYRYGDKKWKNSLRHNLSFNDCFIKVEKNKATGQTRGRKGSYWKLHPNCREMFLNGSTLRRKKRFRETETDHEDDEFRGFEPYKTRRPAYEEVLRNATVTQSANGHSGVGFPKTSIVNQRYSEASSNTMRPPFAPYTFNAVQSDEATRKKPFNSSQFTIESILKSKKKETKDDIQQRSNIHEREIQGSTQIPPHYSFHSWKPIGNEIYMTNKRAHIDERNSHNRQYTTGEIPFKRSQYCCPYCIKISRERSCNCNLCMTRY